MTARRRGGLACWLLALGATLLVFAVPGRASADGRTSFLVEKLKADDFRVRTNAALALGGTNDDVALGPLCGALGDTSDVVRQAVAAAIKRLGRTASLDCLKSHAETEGNASVKLQITRAIEAIEASGGSDPPKANANARYYVAISPVTNNTGRAQSDVERVVLGAIKTKLDALGAYQLAPPAESADSARAQIARRKLKAFYLSVMVEKFDYSDGNLRVRVKVAVFTYPGKDLRGEVPSGLTQSGVRPGDHVGRGEPDGNGGGQGGGALRPEFPMSVTERADKLAAGNLFGAPYRRPSARTGAASP